MYVHQPGLAPPERSTECRGQDLGDGDTRGRMLLAGDR